MSRVGIFGGTFDPPHLGHLIAAQDAWAALRLDHVVFIPASLPPHKRHHDLTSGEFRLAMVRAAIADDARFRASDIELRRGGPSYTVDTLRELKATNPGTDYRLLVGADQFRDMPNWREPDEIARLARIVVLTRGGEDPGVEGGGGLPFRTVPVTRVDIAATEVRRRVAAGEPVRYLVPPDVEEIIRREGLYR